MELAAFIASQRDAILSEWEKNARLRATDHRVEISQLRDHLGEVLNMVAQDLAARPSEGPGDSQKAVADQRVDAAAERHGARRAKQGLNVNQVVSEFPILRSCVERLWLHSLSSVSPNDLDSLVRFDECLDRALSESVAEFMSRLDRIRGTFLGILSHDLRDPLTTVISGGELLLESYVHDAAARDVLKRIVATGERMRHLVGDLLDATRARLGQMPIERHEADLYEAVRHVAAEFRTAQPDREVNVSSTGDAHGQWDDRRISQAVANLTANALRYGATDKPVAISVVADDEVRIAVHNEGAAIPTERLRSLSDAEVNLDMGGDGQRLGLGLYIARAIIDRHGGRLEVDSSAEGGTTFTIHLPRVATTE